MISASIPIRIPDNVRCAVRALNGLGPDLQLLDIVGLDSVCTTPSRQEETDDGADDEPPLRRLAPAGTEASGRVRWLSGRIIRPNSKDREDAGFVKNEPRSWLAPSSWVCHGRPRPPSPAVSEGSRRAASPSSITAAVRFRVTADDRQEAVLRLLEKGGVIPGWLPGARYAEIVNLPAVRAYAWNIMRERERDAAREDLGDAAAVAFVAAPVEPRTLRELALEHFRRVFRRAWPESPPAPLLRAISDPASMLDHGARADSWRGALVRLLDLIGSQAFGFPQMPTWMAEGRPYTDRSRGRVKRVTYSSDYFLTAADMLHVAVLLGAIDEPDPTKETVDDVIARELRNFEKACEKFGRVESSAQRGYPSFDRVASLHIEADEARFNSQPKGAP